MMDGEEIAEMLSSLREIARLLHDIKESNEEIRKLLYDRLGPAHVP